MKKRKVNYIFAVCCCITLLLLLVPILLRLPILRKAITLYLAPLVTSDYKVAYIGTIGSLLGTVMAISGALWTQKKIDQRTLQEEIEQTALMLYHELKFAFDNVNHLVTLYCIDSNKRTLGQHLSNPSAFRQNIKYVQINISDDWQKHLAVLSSSLSVPEINDFYTIYYTLSDIRFVLDNSPDDIPNDVLRRIYSQVRSLTEIVIKDDSTGDFTVIINDDHRYVLNNLRKISKDLDDKLSRIAYDE